MRLEWGGRLGSGGYGEVWRARDGIGRDVAVKFMKGGLGGVSSDEIQEHVAALKRVDHPNVVKIYAVVDLARPGEADQAPEPAIVMEYVPGQDFDDWLGREDKCSADAVAVVRGVLDGLGAFHEQGLAHGDLHGGNIRIDAQGRAKLIDPMARLPETIRSSALTGERRRKDISEARYLIKQALIGHIAPDAMRSFAVLDSRYNSIAELRVALDLALKSPVSASSSTAVQGVYDVCREAQRSGNRVAWQDATDAAIRMVQPALDSWRADFPKLPEEGTEESIFEAVDRLTPILAPLLAAAKFGDRQYSSVFKLVRLVLAAEWPRSGIASYVGLPKTFSFFICYFTGATACRSENLDDALQLANLLGVDADDVEDRPLWSVTHLIGWPPALGNCNRAASMLRDGFGRLAVLRQALATKHDFLVGVDAYNLLLSAIEFASMGADHLQELSELLQSGEYEQLRVPPHYLVQPHDRLREVHRLMFHDLALKDAVCRVGSLTRAEFESHWPTWINASVAFLQQCKVRGIRLPEWVARV